ncbi:6-pyruvoyl-tetrahydropterin synthase-related protein [Patescibacteria group bacterium]
MKKLLRIPKFLFNLIIFLLASFLMFCLAYYFTHSLLISHFNWGNDLHYAFSFIDYFARFYPLIPKWHYGWSGGVPYLHIYPPLAMILTFFYHQISSLSILQTVRLFCWLSVPLAACGIVALGKLATRSWLIGILAGVMLFFSPDTWLWITVSGFYAFAISVPFFTWSLVFYVAALIKNKRFLWFLAIIFYCLTWLVHAMAGTVLTLVLVILGMGYYLQQKKGFLKAIVVSLLPILSAGLLLSFWLLPFYFSHQKGIFFGPEQMPFINFKEMIGLEPARDGVYVTSTFFTASVAILFFVGVIAAFLRKSYVRWLGLACFLALFIITAPGYLPWFISKLTLFWSLSNIRAVLILRILGPIVAAFGAVSLARPPFWLLEKIFSKLKLKENFLWKNFNAILAGIIGVFVFYWLVSNIVIKPPSGQGTGGFYLGFGPLYTWVSLKEYNGKLIDVKRKIEHFPEPESIPNIIARRLIKIDDLKNRGAKIRTISNKLGLTDQHRVEIPPFGGALNSTFTNYSEAGLISSYLGASLITGMISWQRDCFYMEGICSVAELEDLTRWFGISQIWARESEDDESPTSKRTKLFRESDIFEYVETEVTVGSQTYPWSYYNFKDPTGLVSISNKPVILVIGDNPPNNDVFDKTFKILAKIGFGYQHAWSIKGKRFIDSYSLEQLSQFDLIFLHGYQYKNEKKAWDLVAKYLEGGGKVFINTGWQYKVPQWGKLEKEKSVAIELPKVFPVSQSVWGDIGKEWENKKWEMALWDDKPWGMALSKEEWLRNGATPLLVNKDKILAASWNYDQGQVVWTGFDFCGHMAYYDGTEEEKQFFKNIFSSLLDDQEIWEEKLDFDRTNPDSIRINFGDKATGNKLLFKEVDSPGWQARIGKRKLPIYRAGPGWKMVFLPSDIKEKEIIFSYGKAWFHWLGQIISLLTGAILIVYVSRVGDKLFIRFRKKTSALIKTKFKSIKKKWDKDEGY